MPAPQIQALPIPEILLLKPRVFHDARGYFFESHNARSWAEVGVNVTFVQDNTSLSEKGTLRGLHAQVRTPQAKLVRVLDGEIFDVAVDIRRGSPTFGKWVGATLTASGFEQLFIPAGFAHGFCVLSETARIAYKVSDFYDPGGEISVAWNDPALGIDWPVTSPLLSEKDANAPTLADCTTTLPEWISP
jgi:dTDP-4-dehydrorhamnose 3,5-epimerase